MTVFVVFVRVQANVSQSHSMHAFIRYVDIGLHTSSSVLKLAQVPEQCITCTGTYNTYILPGTYSSLYLVHLFILLFSVLRIKQVINTLSIPICIVYARYLVYSNCTTPASPGTLCIYMLVSLTRSLLNSLIMPHAIIPYIYHTTMHSQTFSTRVLVQYKSDSTLISSVSSPPRGYCMHSLRPKRVNGVSYYYGVG